jgi:hypothetical protein
MGDADQISEIKSSLSRIENTQAKIVDLLNGNELDPDDKGLVGKVYGNTTKLSIIERRVDGHDGKIANAKAWFVGACFGGGIVGGVGIYKLIEVFIK